MPRPPRPGKLRWTEQPITEDGIVEWTAEQWQGNAWIPSDWFVRRMPPSRRLRTGYPYEVAVRCKEGVRTRSACCYLGEAKRHAACAIAE